MHTFPKDLRIKRKKQNEYDKLEFSLTDSDFPANNRYATAYF